VPSPRANIDEILALKPDLVLNLDGQEVRSRAARLPKRPRVFFEEWDDPLISGIGWVSELVEIAGGIELFADGRNEAITLG
jgi:iron complex transport system substrate-binding protein